MNITVPKWLLVVLGVAAFAISQAFAQGGLIPSGPFEKWLHYVQSMLIGLGVTGGAIALKAAEDRPSPGQEAVINALSGAVKDVVSTSQQQPAVTVNVQQDQQKP